MALKFRSKKRPAKRAIPARAPERDTAWAFGAQYRACPLEEAGLELQQRVIAHRAEYLCELGWDGHRVLACRAEGEARLFADDLREWTGPFAPIAVALKQLPPRRLVLEGFVCVLDPAGRPSFERLKAWAGGHHEGRLVFAAWDLLMLDGEDLRAQPLRERRAKLERLPLGDPLVLSEPLTEPDLGRLRGSLQQLGVQGLVARSWDSPYPPAEPWALLSTGGAPALDPSKFNLRTIRDRLEARGDLFGPALEGKVQLAPVLARMGLG